ncbi:helix-turn-helix transcriptional regulator [Saccharospirillum sp. MSK14-1]|uniref:helix-turn-helix domain-containing protein n=1 Tax=Saccharospirillum sp. MSK14-1 TaxID=1897632 RepID=UPI0011B1D5DE|nr:helix-turn-helix transcriptional regulator [Saccharospirillum sp. MSK14-1]
MTPSTQINALPLAPKELLYLSGRAHGMSNKEVAREYGVSHRTVEGAMRNILYKLNARKITEAVFKATSEGLLCVVITFATLVTVSLANDQPFRKPSGQTRSSINYRIRIGRNGYV